MDEAWTINLQCTQAMADPDTYGERVICRIGQALHFNGLLYVRHVDNDRQPGMHA